jgi:large conductance mechanosensitive channel
MSFFKEFKEFAMRGNVIDLAVGVVIGGAFQNIVTALVQNIIVPLTGFLTQGRNVADLSKEIPLPEMLIQQGFKPAKITYGAFLQATIDFIIVAFAIFLMVKLLNTLKKKQEAAPEPAAPAPTPEDVLLLREIRDSLVKAAPRRAD